jgi:hypothetical protein
MAGDSYLDLIPIISRPRTVNGVAISEQPYVIMPGSAIGATSPNVSTSADALAPKLVDSNSTDGKPDTFANPTASDFLSWHTAWQIKYIKQQNASGLSATIGSGDSQITAFVGDGTLGAKVFVVENLQKSDIGLMNLATQERLSGLAAWDNAGGMADKLGYKRRDGSSVLSIRNQLKAVLDANYLNSMVQPSVGPMSGDSGKADLKLFTDQIENLKTRLDNSSVFQEANIKAAAEDVLKRYKRAVAFSVDYYKGTDGNVTEGQTIYSGNYITVGGHWPYPDPGVTPGVMSSDGNLTIKEGYDKFIAAEAKLLEADNTRLDLGALVSTQMKNVDLPRMIFLIQMTYDLKDEQQSSETTEELRQQNKYLQDVSLIQRLLNNTLAKFGTGTDETKTLLDINSGTTGFGRSVNAQYITKEEGFMLSMFESYSNAQKYVVNPIEKLQGISSRPSLEILDSPSKYTGFTKNADQNSATFDNWRATFKAFPKSTWEKYSTNISDHVSLISQQSQIKQNEVNAFDRERNRHYDLANNALQKMFDMIGQIARS